MKNLLFKIIDHPDEIRQCFSLRYKVYRYVNFIRENDKELEFDSYDFHSIFLGAYDVDAGNKLIGTVRLINEIEKSKYNHLISNIAKSGENTLNNACEQRPEVFPILEYFNIPIGELKSLLKPDATHDNYTLFEISRLVIDPEYWNMSIATGLRLLVLLEGMINFYRKDVYLITVHPRSSSKYSKQFGCLYIPGLDEIIIECLGQPAVALYMDFPDRYSHMAGSIKEKCESLLPFYRENGFFIQQVPAGRTICDKHSTLNISTV